MPTNSIDYTYKIFKANFYVWDLPKLPKKPGVYILKDKKNKIIYIGETNNLATRLTNHITGKTTELGMKKTGGKLVPGSKVEFKYIYKFDIYIFDKEHKQDRYYLEIKLIRENNPIFNTKYRTDVLDTAEQKKAAKDYMRNFISIRRDKWNKFEQRAIQIGNSYISIDKEWVNALPKNVNPIELSVIQRVNSIFNHGTKVWKQINIIDYRYKELITELISDSSITCINEKGILRTARKIGFCDAGKEDYEIKSLIPHRLRLFYNIK